MISAMQNYCIRIIMKCRTHALTTHTEQGRWPIRDYTNVTTFRCISDEREFEYNYIRSIQYYANNYKELYIHIHGATTSSLKP